MYEYIKGTLIRKTPGSAVIDVQGIGYLLEVSLNTFENLPEVNKTCHLWTYLYVREDIQRLYGFSAERERSLFLELISVSGIGPKVGMGILSGGSVHEVKQQIVNEDVAALKRLPGIGPKTAKRIILELRESLAKAEEDTTLTAVAPRSSLQKEAILALESLGYNNTQATKAVQSVMEKDEDADSVEVVIKKALSTF